MSDTAELPGSVVELRALVLEQQKRLEQQSLFIDQLLEQIRLARHQHFGSRSERFSVDQLALAFNEAKAAAAVSDDADVEQPDMLGTVAVPAYHRAIPASLEFQMTSPALLPSRRSSRHCR